MTALVVKDTQLLEDAAELLRLLAAVEHANLLDDHETIDVLLGQVTGAACRSIAERLEGLAFRGRLVQGTPRLPSPTPPPAAPSSSASAGDVDRERRRSSSVDGPHGIVVDLFPHPESRKA